MAAKRVYHYIVCYAVAGDRQSFCLVVVYKAQSVRSPDASTVRPHCRRVSAVCLISGRAPGRVRYCRSCRVKRRDRRGVEGVAVTRNEAAVVDRCETGHTETGKREAEDGERGGERG
jgi:hypothetical protein